MLGYLGTETNTLPLAILRNNKALPSSLKSWVSPIFYKSKIQYHFNKIFRTKKFKRAEIESDLLADILKLNKNSFVIKKGDKYWGRPDTLSKWDECTWVEKCMALKRDENALRNIMYEKSNTGVRTIEVLENIGGINLGGIISSNNNQFEGAEIVPYVA